MSMKHNLLERREEMGKQNGMLARWRFEEGNERYVTDEIKGLKDKLSYVFHDARFQPDRVCKRRKGIHGQALWFDGFSTFITREKEQIALPAEGFTLSAWVAPSSFGGIEDERLSAIVNQQNRARGTGFILGFHKHGRLGFHVGLNTGWQELTCERTFLKKNEWSMVTAVFDGALGEIKILVNGQTAERKHVLQGATLKLADVDLYIGKNNDPFMVENTFSLNMFSGLMDEVAIYDSALSNEDVADLYQEYLPAGRHPVLEKETIAIQRDEFTNDVHRPRFHASPPGHWMNEPHAPFYYEGKYHLFYQHNPQGPYWGNIHWGHWVSDDLIHWEDAPVALAPELGAVDPDGTWSGCAHMDENGEPVLFFTAGNHQKLPNQMVALANPVDVADPTLAEWNKRDEPDLVQPEGYDLYDDGFRDPFVWKEGGTWFQLVASGINERGGTALLFSSEDLKEWAFHGPLYVSEYERFPYLGIVWELPILLPLGKDTKGEEKHVFIISPVGEGADVEVFYWIGKWDLDTKRFLPDFEEPRLFDYGDFHFTGPSAMADPVKNRLVLFTIAQGERPIEYEYAAGWAHNAGMPAEIFLNKDNDMGIRPIEEVKSLRGRQLVDVQGMTLAEVNQKLERVKGDMLDIELEVETVESPVGIYVRQAPDRSEETLFYYDGKHEAFYVDRNSSTLDASERTVGIQGGKVQLKDELFSLRLILDRSLAEAYVNEKKSLTTRIYPALLESKGLSLKGDEDVYVRSLKVWEMDGIYRSEEC